jgi:cytochrome b6-f complex iron-sulfur subunit
VLGQIFRFLRFYPPDQTPSRITLPLPGAFPAYSEQARVWLLKDVGGLYALDAICTHLGCIVGAGEGGQGFACPCHGSRFTTGGSVENGPATQPLRHLALSRSEDGQLIVDRSQIIDAAIRLPL